MIPLFLLLLPSYAAFAQSEEKDNALDEVVINGAKVVNRIDGKTIYPTDAQKNGSNNGYSILQKLALPNLRIDNVAHTVTAIDNRGGVQLRINNIVVGMQEMLALEPKQISRIDYIDNPGLRYGEGTAYVINIITRRADMGYTLGTDLTPTLTSWQGNGLAYGKWNTRRSEFSLSYGFWGHRLKGAETTEEATYTLSDGSSYAISRNDVETLQESLGHNMKITYNLADSTAFVFQATLSDNISDTPGNYSIKDIADGGNRYTAMSRQSSKYNSPVLDLYLFRQITPRQSVTANAVGTYISTRNGNYYNEGTPYQYDVDGQTASAMSEVIYENRLKPFVLSAGMNYSYKYTRNDYLGDAAALTEMSQNKVYAFGELKGWHKSLRYSLGSGMSYLHYNQQTHRYDFLTFRPKATVSYDFCHGFQARYSFRMQDRASRIAMVSDATIRNNSMEYTVGNPDLKPARDIENSLRLSYNKPRWQSFVESFFRRCHKPNMAHYERTPEDKFIYTQINQKEIDVWMNSAYASYWVLPEKLHVYAYGGMMRCFNFGYDYTHCYTSWLCSGGITAYLGRFTLQAYADNGNRFLEGESRGYTGNSISLQAAYQHKDWQFSLAWSNPFTNRYKASEGELLNVNIHKLTTIYNRDSGNRLSLNVSWRMNRGKRHKTAEKTINLSDKDSGIM